MEFERLVEFGRKVKAFGGSHRGAIMHLNDKLAYLTNLKRSAIYEIEFVTPIGSGCFYAGEAPMFAEKIQEREDKVMFEWTENGNKRKILIPNREGIAEECRKALNDFYVEPTIPIPEKLFDILDPDILITKFVVDGEKLITRQTRSDGSVEIENEINLSTPFQKYNFPRAEIDFFTSDLFVMKGYVSELYVAVKGNDFPMSFKGKFGKNKIRGLISYLIYE